MKKIVTLFATVLLLYGCGSVPLTGRKQMLFVSDSEVLSSSLTQYSEYIKSAPISSNATKKHGDTCRKENSRCHGTILGK